MTHAIDLTALEDVKFSPDIKHLQSSWSDLLMEVLVVDINKGQPIKQHRAPVRVIEPLHKVHHGGLAAS